MICWQIWKTFCKAKTPPDEFKVTTSKNSLINNQAITSIRNFTTILTYPKIPTYSWTFAPIPNWTWFCSRLFSFDAQISNPWLNLCIDPGMWLIPATWIIVVGYKVLHFINVKDHEALSYKTLWCTNAVISHRGKWILGFCICVWRLLT